MAVITILEKVDKAGNSPPNFLREAEGGDGKEEESNLSITYFM